MQTLDWTIVLLYMAATLALGVYLARRASGSLEDFFVSGRSLPWWLAGTSMAATTFSIDTPLYIAGVVGSRGCRGELGVVGVRRRACRAHLSLRAVVASQCHRHRCRTD